MHKDEAAYLFGILGDSVIVKIIKFLYVKGPLSFNDLGVVSDLNEMKLNATLDKLCLASLVLRTETEMYRVNKKKVDELMEFVRTPCECTSK
ncbi:MAG: hypothetical protein J6I69_00495 [Bacilli bacterium]|nr:hypothetical protein [Bacilli bacterium]